MIRLLFGIEGRIGVSTFRKIFFSVLLLDVILIGVCLLSAKSDDTLSLSTFKQGWAALDPVMQWAFGIAFALSYWIFTASYAKRLHDLDMSGWWAVVFNPTAYGPAAVRNGTRGPNRYGPDPLEAEFPPGKSLIGKMKS
jgi:uncharacterized membrane protein YhaH (DUF805 family)